MSTHQPTHVIAAADFSSTDPRVVAAKEWIDDNLGGIDTRSPERIQRDARELAVYIARHVDERDEQIKRLIDELRDAYKRTAEQDNELAALEAQLRGRG